MLESVGYVESAVGERKLTAHWSFRKVHAPTGPRPQWAHVRAVCFDLERTLVRFWPTGATERVAEVLGLSPGEARAVMGPDAMPLAAAKGPARERVWPSARPAEPVTVVVEHARRFTETPDVYPDVYPVLTALRERGFTLIGMTDTLGCSVSGGGPDTVRELLHPVLHPAHTAAISPERAFAEVAKAAGLQSHELLYVGGCAATGAIAASAGWNTARLDRHHMSGPLTAEACTARLHSLNTLPLLLPFRAAAVTLSDMAG
ncbi:HAD family hydrolase [Streptomyces sp. NBC_01237]|uniref:HAD family hydrolase n=1 Tax=Streptomyces sp. NBC_01237 TaxID=2903790 RepID=UPI002DD98EF6|nr:HAD family hydrolase [Streptomyces sp. NBC_01237]WRZ77282.1 HAD family hydrolase [Streptomyces sp. NBC_01237]